MENSNQKIVDPGAYSVEKGGNIGGYIAGITDPCLPKLHGVRHRACRCRYKIEQKKTFSLLIIGKTPTTLRFLAAGLVEYLWKSCRERVEK